MKLAIIVFSVILSMSLNGQKLSDKYKKESIKLIAASNFGENNQWGEIFKTYYDTTFYGKQIGKNKSLIVLDDGRIVVNNIYQNFYTIFNADGSFDKELFVKNTNGNVFKKTRSIYGVINNTFYTNADNMGKILCFDFDGKYKKTLKLNYSVRQIITLNNSKLAVVGWSIWKDKFRDFVAIVDYNTNEQTIVWDQFTENNPNKKQRFNYNYTFDNGYKISINTMPFTKVTGMSLPPIIQEIKNNLIIAIPNSGQILTYNTVGKQINSSTIKWAKNYISVDEQKEIQNKAIAKYKNINGNKIMGSASIEENNKALSLIIKQMEKDLQSITNKLSIPVFATMIKDSDDNLLFFEITKKDNQNKFNVWTMDNNGDFIAKSSFVCDNYKLKITPKKMFFHNGFLYSLQTKKGVKGNPLRLVKFRLD